MKIIISKFTYKNGSLVISVSDNGMTYEAKSFAPRLHANEKVNEILYSKVMDVISELQDVAMHQMNKAEDTLTKAKISKYLEEAFNESKSRFEWHPKLFTMPVPQNREYNPIHKIDRVIFKDPATIVFWDDGTKTVVKAKKEPYDKEKGLAMAFMKKHLGNKGKYFDTVKKYTKEKNNENNA